MSVPEGAKMPSLNRSCEVGKHVPFVAVPENGRVNFATPNLIVLSTDIEENLRTQGINRPLYSCVECTGVVRPKDVISNLAHYQSVAKVMGGQEIGRASLTQQALLSIPNGEVQGPVEDRYYISEPE